MLEEIQKNYTDDEEDVEVELINKRGAEEEEKQKEKLEREQLREQMMEKRGMEVELFENDS